MGNGSSQRGEMIRVVDFEPGDRYLNGQPDAPPFIVAAVRYRGESDIGGSAERQRYQLEATDGRLSPVYAGDSKAYRLAKQA